MSRMELTSLCTNNSYTNIRVSYDYKDDCGNRQRHKTLSQPTVSRTKEHIDGDAMLQTLLYTTSLIPVARLIVTSYQGIS